MSDTPRTDGLILAYENEPDGVAWPNFENGIRQLELDAHQTRMDAVADSKRLIDDKMKMFERITELERELSTIRARTEGMVMVPREPTEAMIFAGMEAYQLFGSPMTRYRNIYKAMIDAS